MRVGQTMLLRGFAVLLAVVMLALLAAACGGGGEGDGAEKPSGDETPQAGETPPADGADGDEGDGEGDGLQDLEALASEAAKGVTAKITYKYRSEAGGEVTEGEWVLVQRPPDSRFEISGTDGGEEFRTIVITSGGKSYLCIAGGGQESCLTAEAEETESQTALFEPVFDIPREIAEEAADVDLVDKSERRIAGLDATCFVVRSGIADLGEGEMCFSDDGILLLLRGESDAGSFTFEATSASTDVTDADFEPPYEVIELPGT